MARADSVHSTPPTNTSPPQPCLPPPVGIARQGRFNPAALARKDGHPLAHLMKLRDEAAAEVERLLAFLDATDGHEDDEDEGLDEPSLGSTCDYGGNGASYESVPSGVDDLEGPDVDLEPSLCGVTVELRGNDQDLEEEAGCERECDPSESGIGDFDGLQEQLQGRDYAGCGENGFTRYVA